MDRHYDAVVIGSGSAGTAAAMRLRKAGRTVAVVDDRPFGGTCALRGCDPKKVLVAAAAAVDRAQRLAQLGAIDRAPTLQWPQLMRFKRTFTDPVSEQRLAGYRDAGIEPIAGRARFESPSVLRVNDDAIAFTHAVIASGAKPQHVVPGDEVLLTSDDFLELEEMPASLVFVGGGYIAFEFAHVAARAGAQVTILHRDAHPLAGFDAEVVERLLGVTRDIGVDVVLETPATGVRGEGDSVVVTADAGGARKEFRAKAGVLGAGRVADVDGLELQAANVERTKRGVRVDGYLRSVSNPAVYAAGDAADGGGLPLTPVASYEGDLAARNILQADCQAVDTRGLVSMVYTTPPLGTVGLTQERARASGVDAQIHSGDMTQWYSARHVAARGAYYKIVIERNSRKVLGATIFGPDAQEQINVLALAVRHELTVDGVLETLFGYPTGSSDMDYMLG